MRTGVVSVGTTAPDRRELLLRGDAAPVCDAPVSPAQVLGEVVAVTRGPRGRLFGTSRDGGPRSAWPADCVLANDESTRFMKSITTAVLNLLSVSRSLAGWTVAILVLCAVPQDARAAVLQQVQSGTAVNNAQRHPDRHDLRDRHHQVVPDLPGPQQPATGRSTPPCVAASRPPRRFSSSARPTKARRSRSTSSGTWRRSARASTSSAAPRPCRR